jgi:predicted RNase H-like nuclease
MTLVLGLDGCPAGWCGVTIDARDGCAVALPQTVFPTFADALATEAAVIAIDIPIGLLDVPGGRGCDVEARRLLGPPRASSVFPAPSRRASAVVDYREACDINFELTGRRLSRQVHNIVPKIREVDQEMKPDLQERVFEVHPEVCFWALSLGPLAHPKKRLAGRLERWSLLRSVLPGLPGQPPVPREMPQRCGVDDYVDALVCAWTALCLFEGRAKRVPLTPDVDERGLRMEIWFPA